MKRHFPTPAVSLAILFALIIMSQCLLSQCLETVEVGSWGHMTRTMRLYVGDSAEGTLQVNSGHGTLIVKDPDGQTVAGQTVGASGLDEGGTATFSFFVLQRTL